MVNILDLAALLSKAEQRLFTNYLIKRNKRYDHKNVALFKAINNNTTEELKLELGMNAFNVLKKRLSDRLIDFCAQLTFNQEAVEEMYIVKCILVARRLFSYEKYKSANGLLNKAEKEAIKIGHFSLLNEIYHYQIQFSHVLTAEEQDQIFEKFEKNKIDFLAEERLNMVYAVVRKAFNIAEHENKPVDIEQLLKVNYAKYGITDSYGYNFKSLCQIAEIADIQGAYHKNYHSVNLFFVDKIKALKGGPLDSEKHLKYHINLLYSMANIYFRKKMFSRSQAYLKDMYDQMKLYKSKLYNSNYLAYLTLHTLNLNFTNQQLSAVKLLDEALNSSDYNFEDCLNLYLVRIMIHFQMGELESVKMMMAKLQHSNKWYEQKMGLEWLLNKKYIEILLQIELGNIDLVDSRIKSLERRHTDYFKSRPFQIPEFLKLVKQYYHHPDNARTKSFHELVEHSINWKPIIEEDIFLICFFAWLKSKMYNTPLYQTTLDIINQHQHD